MNPYSINGDQVILVPLAENNYDDFLTLLANSDVFRSSMLYSNEMNISMSQDRLFDCIKEKSYAFTNKVYLIKEIDPDGILGLCAVNNIDWAQGRADLTLLMDAGELKQKQSADPLKALLRKAVRVWGINKIYTRIYKDDLATATVLKSFGFFVEAELKEYVCYEGEWLDINNLSLSKSNLHIH